MIDRRAMRDIATLFAFQFANYAVPLLTTPYLTRTLGVQEFGILGVSTGIISYLLLLGDWGFGLTATQHVARCVGDESALRRVFWDVIAAKTLLAVAAVVLFTALVFAIEPLRRMWLILIVSYLQVVAGVTSVTWFLQGIEKMGSMAVANFLGRMTVLPLTFLLVHGPSDVVMAAVVQGVAALVAAAATMVIAIRSVSLGAPQWRWAGAANQISDGFRMFLSTAAISLYTQLNIVVLGFVGGPAQAGLFNGADRIKRVAQAVTGPISTAMYPRINRMMVQARHRAFGSMMQMLVIQGAVTLALSVVLFLTAPWITVKFLGQAYVGAVPVVQWLSATPFLIGISNVLGINIMLPVGMKSAFTTIVVASGLFNLALLYPLTTYYGAVGAAASLVLTEVVVVVLMAAWLVLRRDALARVFGGAEP